MARAEKVDLRAAIDARADAGWRAALDIWGWAEPGYQETRSAERLATLLAEAGFRVERGVAGMPTAFLATFGAGEPVVGILGEYDALPGLSQQATPERAPRTDENSYGHACGHHLFGVASALAAIAVAERIASGELHGTVRYYGCPAEEGGCGKVFLVRAGLFDDCSAVLHWHPSARNSAGDPSCLSRIAAKFRFHGRAAHAGSSPEQGRSALDGVELMNHAAELMREHTPNLTRIHHVITAGGDAPNVVPEFAEVYYYVRHPEAEVVRDLYRRLLLCAQAGALATETQLETLYLGGTMPILPNETLARVTLANLRAENDLKFDPEQTQFAARLQQSLDSPPPLVSVAEVTDASGTTKEGSTDVGDVSWVVPTSGFSTACWVPGTPGHSWQAVAAGGTTIGRQGMLLAARVLAATAWDLYNDREVLRAAKEEHVRRRADREYRPLLEADQPPPLDYRNPPRGRAAASD
ncbi:MAG: amidohydrolase [Pirellulales bacterium]|nr:amidohydrolase [Pirellulales bacterium]